MTFSPKQIEMLEAPLDPANVKPPPQGKYGEYVDAYHVICEANRIFRHDGWSYEITALAPCWKAEAKDRNGNPQVRVGYRCQVRVRVGEVYREGSAVGTGMAKPENEGDAHESAVKEAETDALKRALRSFGNTFGLALYDKTKANVSAPTITDDQHTELVALFDATGFPVARFLETAKIDDLRKLPAERFDGARKWINEQAKELENA